MKTIKQNAGYQITMNRLDTGAAITIEPGVDVELDDATADHLLAARQYYTPVDENGVDLPRVLATDFVLV